MRHQGYFTAKEIFLWFASAVVIIITFLRFDGENHLTLAASLIGITSLLLNAKGNPFGQLLMVIFSILYGIISYSFRYYGEMITYLGMTMPMAVFALVSWLRNPYNGNRTQVRVNRISHKETLGAVLLTIGVTFAFYWILAAFDTAYIMLSTFSVTTSFLAVYLTFRRSAFFAAAYAANDLVLIVLWTMAAQFNSSYWSVVACFFVFLINDLYGYISWRQMAKNQSAFALASKAQNG